MDNVCVCVAIVAVVASRAAAMKNHRTNHELASRPRTKTKAIERFVRIALHWQSEQKSKDRTREGFIGSVWF